MKDVSAGLDPAPRLGTDPDPDIVVGLGLRRAATPAELLALVDACLALAGRQRRHIALCATLEAKADHPSLLALAQALGVPLVAMPPGRLDRAVPNPSPLVASRLGLASVAEAAALAHGPLLVEKRRSANATCALALLASPYCRSSAAIAAATLATSRAGP